MRTRSRSLALEYVLGMMLVTGLLIAWQSNAASGLCAAGKCTQETRDFAYERHSAEAANVAALADIARSDLRRANLSDQEYFSFSGVGAVVCTVNGQQRTSTAFLVGAFDIGVTVAHTFVDNGQWAQPDNCVYTTTDSIGQIRERIPVAYIKAQWEAEAGAFGQLAKDLAVIRLVEPSRFAQRTMPLGKFSGFGATVLMIGFKADMDSDTTKLKTRGTVYERKANGIAISSLAGFTHDMDARDIAAGAPVIDERSGVIIGIHTAGLKSAAAARPQRNTMITMNEWLEATLRTEMQSERAASTR
jgi:V8-like Glu-specific endopeptidase